MTFAFLLTTLVVAVIPGTGVLYTLSAALSRGARAGVIAAVGCTLGIVPHLLAAITGLAALLNASALAFQTVKYVGVAYLLYMAWATVKDRQGLAIDTRMAPRSATRVIVRGILINILNPKLTIFFFAFLPQFVTPGAPGSGPGPAGSGAGSAGSLVRMAGLSGVFMLMTFVVFVGYGVFAAGVRRHILARPQVMTWMRRTFAATFVALGIRLAVADR